MSAGNTRPGASNNAENANATEDNEEGANPEQEGNEGAAEAEGDEGQEPGTEEGEGSVDDGEEGEGGEDAGQPSSRGQNRFQKLSRTAQEANERAAKVERELADLRAQTQARAQQEDPAAEAARMALMSPEERTDYRLNQAEQRNQQNINALRFQTQDQIDKAGFDAKAQYDPLVKKHAPEVEKRLTAMRQNGMNAPRDAVLTYVLGEIVRTQGTKKTAEQKGKGQENIRRQETTVTNNKGDTATNRGKAPKSAEDRLSNVTF